jgi:DNA-binding beta-propeller fold protein YncE
LTTRQVNEDGNTIVPVELASGTSTGPCQLRPRGSAFAVGVSLVMLALSIVTTSASAAEVHVFSSSFGSGLLSLSEHSGVAVDDGTGNVYVADTGDGRVAEFEPDGTFLRGFGTFTTPTFIAVDNSAGGSGSVYVADTATGSVYKFAADGTPDAAWGMLGQLSGFGTLAGIAVDPSGDLLVLEEDSITHKYTATGAEVGSFEATTRGTAPAGLASDTEADLYKITGILTVVEFDQTGRELGEPDSSEAAAALATDPSSGDLYVAEGSGGGFVNHFALGCGLLPKCSPNESFGAGQLSGPQGIAVNGATGTVYVTQSGASTVAVAVVEDIEPPSVSISEPTEVHYTTAHVAGEVDPEGVNATCQFEYVTDQHFGEEGFAGAASTPCATQPGAGTAPQPVEADLEGLSIHTAYHVRLSARNAAGTTFSPEPNPAFETEEVVPPTVSIDPVASPVIGNAHYSGTIDPNAPAPEGQTSPAEEAAFRTTWHFQCTPACPGLAGGTLGADDAPHAVEAEASGLEPDTAYEVSLIAENLGGQTVAGPEPFTTGAVSATVATGHVFSATDTTATLSGTLDLRNSPLVDCHFDYGTTLTYGQSAPCSPGAAAIEDRDEVQQVTVPAAGIFAGSAGGFRLGLEGSLTTFLPFGEPAGAVQTALDELATIGGVGGSVEVTGGPQAGVAHPYIVSFEGSLSGKDVEELRLILENASGRSIEVAPDEAAIETTNPGGPAVGVSADVAGLQPGTPYHFRLVIDNGVGGPQDGSDESFTTRSAAEVDHAVRHYELVSAADTNGVEATPDVASADGEAYAYSTFLPTPPDPVSGKQSLYVATRGPDGTWSQRPADIPARPGAQDESSFPELFSEDLSRVALETQTSSDPEDQNGTADVYLKQVPSGQLTWLSRDPSIAGPQTEKGKPELPEYISPDGTTVVFKSERDLLPADASGTVEELYQWREGTLSFLSLIPASGSTCGGAGTPCVGATEVSLLGSNVDEFLGTSYDTVARDVSRVVFETGSPSRLYVRLDGERTVEADASAPGAPPLAAAPRDVTFQGADEEDEQVFFTSSSPLTPDSSAPDTPRGGGTYRASPSHADLFDYDVASGSLRDLTPSAGGAGIERVYDVSADGRRLYFTSKKRLGEGGQLTETAASGEGLQGAPGGPNLYLAEPGGTGVRIRFIATIDPLEDTQSGATPGVYTPQAFRETAASADGSLLAFRDVLNAVPGRRTGGFSQVFVYDAERGELSCASCPGDGGPAAGPANTAFHNFFANGRGPHFRGVSSEGSVFLESPTALVGQDADGVGDVYEWRGGTLALVSAGTGVEDSKIAGASTDGSTVFFASADSLVPGAQAGIPHIYAARVGPASERPTPTPPCSGEDCRGPTSGRPATPGPGTTALGGPGNRRLQRHCPRSRRPVRRGATVRCVARHKHRKHEKRHPRYRRKTNDRRASR